MTVSFQFTKYFFYCKKCFQNVENHVGKVPYVFLKPKTDLSRDRQREKLQQNVSKPLPHVDGNRADQKDQFPQA